MGGKAQQELAVVVVNYASHWLLGQNLTIVARENPQAHIVVVDSYSSDAEQRAVANMAYDHGWTLVRTGVNVGFGGGMNLGVAAAKELGAKTFLLLNPDASLSRASVETLCHELDREPLTLFAPVIYDAEGKIWFDGADVLLESGRTQSVARTKSGAAEAIVSGHAPPRSWPWLTGACLLVGEGLWDLVGGFDERFFLYWEDVDFSRRVLNAGGQLKVVPTAKAVHDEGGTQKPLAGQQDFDAVQHRGKSATYYYYNVRNRLLFAALHLSSEDQRRWRRSSVAAAWEILLRGGRRQFLHRSGAVGAAVKGTRDGLGLMRTVAKDQHGRDGTVRGTVR